METTQPTLAIQHRAMIGQVSVIKDLNKHVSNSAKAAMNWVKKIMTFRPTLENTKFQKPRLKTVEYLDLLVFQKGCEKQHGYVDQGWEYEH